MPVRLEHADADAAVPAPAVVPLHREPAPGQRLGTGFPAGIPAGNPAELDLDSAFDLTLGYTAAADRDLPGDEMPDLPELTVVPVVPVVSTVAAVPAAAQPQAPAPVPAPVPTVDIDELLNHPHLLAGLSTPCAREAGDRMLARLATLEQGTAEHSYLRGVLVELNLPMVRHAAGRYRRRGEPIEDIVQVGTIGLIKAIDRYEADRGSSFMAYAMPTIIGEIKRFFRDTSWSVRVPRRLRELRTELLRATDELTARNGRTPTPRDLAERLGISEEEVVEGLDACTVYTATSLDETAYGDADSQETVGDRLGAEDHELDLVEYREALRPLLAELPGRERAILVMRFYGNLTQAQIGERVGISQMHVSRLLARTLAALRERLMVAS